MTLSVSPGEGYVRSVAVDEEESTIVIYDNWRQVRQTVCWQLHPSATLVGSRRTTVLLPVMTMRVYISSLRQRNGRELA